MVQISRPLACFSEPRRPVSAAVKAGRRGSERHVGREAVRRPGSRCSLVDSGLALVLPLLLELRRRQVAQRRVDALVVVDRVDEVAKLPVGIGVVLVLRQVYFLFLDRPHQPLGVTVLARFAGRRPPDRYWPSSPPPPEPPACVP